MSAWPKHVPKDQQTYDEAGYNAALTVPTIDGHGLLPSSGEFGAIRALDIAVFMAKQQGADPAGDAKVKRILALIGEEFPHGNLSRKMGAVMHFWPLLIQGALAREMGFQDEELELRAAELKNAFQRRYYDGPSNRNHLAVPDMMKTCSDLAVKNDDYVDAHVAWNDQIPVTLFRSPATEADIKALEDWINMQLPEDYKTFLQHSNGFEPMHNIYGGLDEGLFRTTEVRWEDQEEEYFDPIELPYNLEQHHNPRYEGEVLTIDKVLYIGDDDDVDWLWLIHPELMHRARDMYNKIYDLADEADKKIIERAIIDFAGSWEEWEKLDWGFMWYQCGTGIEPLYWSSFRSWLEEKVYDSKHGFNPWY